MNQCETSVKNGKNDEPNNHGKPNSPKILVLNEYGFIGCAFLISTQKDDGNLPYDKIPGKMRKRVNLKNTGRPIYLRCQYLLNMISMVTHFFYQPKRRPQMILLVSHLFYYLKKMATSYGSILLQCFMTLEKKYHKTQVISSS